MSKLFAAIRRFRPDDRAQALPVVALMLISLLGMCGIVVDVGHAYFSFRELQASTDAAALAGAKTLPSTTATTIATKFSGTSGSNNAQANLTGVTMVSGYPKILCLTTLKNEGMACTAPAYGNAVAVQQQVSVPTWFLKVIGKSSFTVKASATAAMRGGTPTPYNIAIVMDQTLSMNIIDTNCGSISQNACALNGVQILLQNLTPCAMSLTTCTITNGISANSVDNVALFGFPAFTTGTVAMEYGCTTNVPANGSYPYLAPYGYFTWPSTSWSGIATSQAYVYPTAGASSYTPSGGGTYQITGFLSDYRTSDTATTLNSASNLVKAAGGVSGCGGMQPPNYDAVYMTYYAAALYAAQSALVAQAAANPGTQNVLIFLSDGDANAPQTNTVNGSYPVMQSPATNSGLYPSYVNECSQAITAAAAATAAGTRVYSVAYGSPTSGCSTDTSGTYAGISPCQTMANIASAPQYFFSDYLQSNQTTTCYSTEQPVTSLAGIFQQIAADLTVARLIPDNTP